MTEQATLFGRTHPLVGVISTPDAVDPLRPAVLLLNAGIVSHVGPGRSSVRLARHLAERGYVAARFDHGGVGDSDARRDSMPFEQSSVAEAREVMDDLARLHGCRRFLLMGLCSGASTAFLAAEADARVAGVVLINPPGGGGGEEVDHAVINEHDARRYWSVALFDPDAWRRALTGRIQYGLMIKRLWKQLVDRVRPPAGLGQQRGCLAERIAGVAGRGRRLLFIFSQRDQTSEFVQAVLAEAPLKDLTAREWVRQVTIAGTEHTFALRANQEELMGVVGEFLGSISSARGSAKAQAAAFEERRASVSWGVGVEDEMEADSPRQSSNVL